MSKINQELSEKLRLIGYTDLKQIEGRGICGIRQFIFTYGLAINITEQWYDGRYCYPDLQQAKKALEIWDGQGDPKGLWIKYKGKGGEYRSEYSKAKERYERAPNHYQRVKALKEISDIKERFKLPISSTNGKIVGLNEN